MDAIIANPTSSTTAAPTPPPSLLTVILDTNPFAWDDLSQSPHNFPLLPTALSQLLLFINAHLAFSQENRVAVLASHCGRTKWLYPSAEHHNVEETGAVTANGLNGHTNTTANVDNQVPPDANKYRPFAIVEHAITKSLRALLSSTTLADLETYESGGTPIAGALTLALSYINRLTLSFTPSHSTNTAGTANASVPNEDKIYGSDTTSSGVLDARVLIISTSGDLAGQYIPLMNGMFAAQSMGVPIDVLKLDGDSVLLQQCSDTTGGVFVTPVGSPAAAAAAAAEQEQMGQIGGITGNQANGTAENHSKLGPIALLPCLFTAFLPSPTTRHILNAPTAPHVDFRAACFCHRRVVDIGLVCSICLSIFCDEGVGVNVQTLGKEVGRSVSCLTCGSALIVGGSGSGVVNEEGGGKKKKKKRKEGDPNPQ